MREILFRGQTRRYGEKVRIGDKKPIESNWVYGGVFPNNSGGQRAIIYQQHPDIQKFSVYAETVGQYTGITDKNGTKIFEGDITLVLKDGEIQFEGAVIWGHGSFEIRELPKEDGCCMCLAYCDGLELKVIGNIFDNPNWADD